MSGLKIDGPLYFPFIIVVFISKPIFLYAVVTESVPGLEQ